MEGETTTSSESNHYHNHETSSDTESDQLDWDPERIDDDGYPLVDENGSTLVPVPREGPLEEDEASSLTAWAQGYREVRKNLRDSVTGRGYYKPESSRHKKVVRKTMFQKKPPRRDRNIRTPFRNICPPGTGKSKSKVTEISESDNSKRVDDWCPSSNTSAQQPNLSQVDTVGCADEGLWIFSLEDSKKRRYSVELGRSLVPIRLRSGKLRSTS